MGQQEDFLEYKNSHDMVCEIRCLHLIPQSIFVCCFQIVFHLLSEAPCRENCCMLINIFGKTYK